MKLFYIALYTEVMKTDISKHRKVMVVKS